METDGQIELNFGAVASFDLSYCRICKEILASTRSSMRVVCFPLELCPKLCN